MKLQLAYYGDPILRKKGKRVDEINDELIKLVQDMVETMNEENGIGLAAPQIHHSLALFITCVPLDGPDETTLPGTLRVFINPKILWISDKMWEHSEGCLSIPKLYGKLERPYKVKVEYTNLEGERLTEEFSGLEASAVFHENDHINGILFIDRMKPKDKQKIEPLLREVEKEILQKTLSFHFIHSERLHVGISRMIANTSRPK